MLWMLLKPPSIQSSLVYMVLLLDTDLDEFGLVFVSLVLYRIFCNFIAGQLTVPSTTFVNFFFIKHDDVRMNIHV